MNQKSASSLQFEVSYQQFLQTFFFYNGGFWGKKKFGLELLAAILRVTTGQSVQV